MHIMCLHIHAYVYKHSCTCTGFKTGVHGSLYGLILCDTFGTLTIQHHIKELDITSYYLYWLVVWNIFHFSHIIPTDFHIFEDG